MGEGLDVDCDEVSVEGVGASVWGVEGDTDLLIEYAFLMVFKRIQTARWQFNWQFFVPEVIKVQNIFLIGMVRPFDACLHAIMSKFLLLRDLHGSLSYNNKICLLYYNLNCVYKSKNNTIFKGHMINIDFTSRMMLLLDRWYYFQIDIRKRKTGIEEVLDFILVTLL